MTDDYLTSSVMFAKVSAWDFDFSSISTRCHGVTKQSRQLQITISFKYLVVTIPNNHP